MAYIRFLRFIFLINLISLAWSSEVFDVLILDTSSASAKANSVNSAMAELYRRRTKGDLIAGNILSTMSCTQFREKEAAVTEYNRRLIEQEKIRSATQGLNLSGNIIGTPSKVLGQVVRRQQELEEQNRTLQEQLAAKEREKEEAANRAAMYSPEAKAAGLLRQQSTKLERELDEAKERLKSSEQRIQELEARMGQEAIGAIHDNIGSAGAIANGGTIGGKIKLDAIGHLRQSYLDMIDDLGGQQESSVVEDSEMVRKKVEETAAIFAGADESNIEEVRAQALALTQSTFDIVSKYEELKIDVFERKVRDAITLEALKKIVIDDIFYDVFLSKMSELELRILNLDVLQQSLDLTKLYQDQLEQLIKLNLYSPSKLSAIRQFLTTNENMLGRKIEERDEAIRDEYQLSLLAVKQKMDALYAEYQLRALTPPIPKEYDLAYVSVPLQLMRSPIAFFLLAKSDFTDKKFNDIQILDQSLIYLTREQTRAFFVYLYDVHTNFSAYKKRFEEVTLASPPPFATKRHLRTTQNF